MSVFDDSKYWLQKYEIMLMWQSNFGRLTQIGLKVRATRRNMGNFGKWQYAYLIYGVLHIYYLLTRIAAKSYVSF
jgi:hypothetical protein